MEKIKVMVTGIKGAMGTEIAKHLSQLRDEFELIPTSFVSQNTTALDHRVPGVEKPFVLIKPAMRDEDIENLKQIYGQFIAVDFARSKTNPHIPNEMADFYCRHAVPFVMGATGGNRPALEERIRASDIVAVVGQNMALEIVGFKEVMTEFANVHRGEMTNYRARIVESHQAVKPDPSGTAVDIIKCFQVLGIPCDISQVNKKDGTMIRDEEGYIRLGVPKQFWGGHGWHTYTISGKSNGTSPLRGMYLMLYDFLSSSPVFKGYSSDGEEGGIARISPDGNIVFRLQDNAYVAQRLTSFDESITITHNVNGRGIYLPGVAQALRFEHQRIQAGDKGKMYDMIPVLRAM